MSREQRFINKFIRMEMWVEYQDGEGNSAKISINGSWPTSDIQTGVKGLEGLIDKARELGISRKNLKFAYKVQRRFDPVDHLVQQIDAKEYVNKVLRAYVRQVEQRRHPLVIETRIVRVTEIDEGAISTVEPKQLEGKAKKKGGGRKRADVTKAVEKYLDSKPDADRDEVLRAILRDKYPNRTPPDYVIRGYRRKVYDAFRVIRKPQVVEP